MIPETMDVGTMFEYLFLIITLWMAFLGARLVFWHSYSLTARAILIARKAIARRLQERQRLCGYHLASMDRPGLYAIHDPLHCEGCSKEEAHNENRL